MASASSAAQAGPSRPYALLSVSDKRGLLDLARALVERHALLASGGTARALREAGLPVQEVADYTGAAEILGGRVKTLHPRIAGGILAQRTPTHLADLEAVGGLPIDVVVCNLYPFAATVAAHPDDEAAAIEDIDIGGITLLRAAAKNHAAVLVCCDPSDYAGLAAYARGELREDVALATRKAMAAKAFALTAAYDAAIAAWFAARVAGAAAAATSTPEAAPSLPERLQLDLQRVATLRYGENPHQEAALYRAPSAAGAFEQLGGKELSYNNVVDLEAAWAMARGLGSPAVAVVKHTNPCGFAVAETPTAALSAALAADPTSAFGSIIACNRLIDMAFVETLGDLFVEVLVAPGFDPVALEALRRRKRNCRLMAANGTAASGEAASGFGLELRIGALGVLAQTPDPVRDDPELFRVVSARQPEAATLADLRFAWHVAAHVKSNAIVLVRDGAAVGVGAGQMSRVDAVDLAVRRAGARARGTVMASDAFFPFADGIERAAEAGVVAVIQPGGSVRDAEVLAAVDRLGMAMVLTGVRHFRHG